MNVYNFYYNVILLKSFYKIFNTVYCCEFYSTHFLLIFQKIEIGKYLILYKIMDLGNNIVDIPKIVIIVLFYKKYNNIII